MKGIKLLVLLLFIGLGVFAQEKSLKDYSTWRVRQMGKNAERLNDPYHAIDFYSHYLSRKDNYKVRFSLAELHMETRDYKSALNELTRLQNKYDSRHDLLFLEKGRALKSMGLYDKAVQNFSKFRNDYKGKDKNYYRKRAKIEIEGCELLNEKSANSDKYVIEQLKGDVNHAHLEFSPSYYKEDKLIYGSLKTDQLVFEDSTDSPNRKLYLATKKSQSWFDISSLSLSIPKNMEIGSFSINEDATEMYLSLCVLDWQHRPQCAIYRSKNQAMGWTIPQKLGTEVNLPNSNNTQPCLGYDPKKKTALLYFVSDRKGGKGKLDIWYARWNERSKSFDRVRNAGSKINSTENERTPYFEAEKSRLYFSSDGNPSLGGYDIFYALGNKSKWSKAVNLGPDFNSSYDELDFHIKGSNGFFVSNRTGTTALKSEHCCDDIFSFVRQSDFEEEVIVEVYELESSTEFGNKVDSSTAIALPNFPVDISLLNGFDEETKEESTSDDEDASIYLKEIKTGEKGTCSVDLDKRFNYRFIVDQPNYFYTYSELINNQDLKPNKEVFKGNKKVVKLYVSKLNLLEIIIPNIYYPFDEYYLTSDAMRSLDTTVYQLLIDNPSIIIEIGSHTDSKGSDAYNQNLSQNRAKSVVNYLKKKGVSKQRLSYKGYGESIPLVSNTKADGSDDLIGRAKNRRTSFKVIGVLKDGEKLLFDKNFGGIKADR